MTGRMGAVIAVAHYAREKHSDALDSIADIMIDSVIKSLPYLRDFSFSTGLCGIMWGVEYLVQSGLMPGPADEICKEADKIIDGIDLRTIRDLSLETGLSGIWECVWARIQGNIMAGLPLPYSKEYLERWLPILRDNPGCFTDNSVERLETAINGILIIEELDIKKLISLRDNDVTDSLSLSEGCAGKLLMFLLK